MYQEDDPLSVSMGYKEITLGDRTVILTNALWKSSPETGVRINGKFELIQHGWLNFDKANDFILKALSKGWDCWKLSEVMTWMHDNNRWETRHKKAKVL